MSSEDTPSRLADPGDAVRSGFLVHWIGRDIHQADGHDNTPCDWSDLGGDRNGRERYLSHLHGALNNGLWVTPSTETLGIPGGVQMTRREPVTCFTELRLSDARSHTQRYGCLGLGFTRDFVLDRTGSPVHYVACDPNDVATKALLDLQSVLLMATTTGDPDAIVVRNPKQFIENWEHRALIEGRSDRPALNATVREFANYVLAKVSLLSAYSKPMSDSQNPFQYLDEMEWRIVHSDRPVDEGQMIPVTVPTEHAEYKIPFAADDLKLLILPDDETRGMMFDSKKIMEWFRDKKGRLRLPMISTVEECANF